MKLLLSLLFLAVFMSTSVMAQDYVSTDLIAEVTHENTNVNDVQPQGKKAQKKLKKQALVKKKTQNKSSVKLINHRAVIDRNKRVASRY